MTEYVDGIIIGPLTYRAGIFINGHELASSSVFENYSEAFVWGVNWCRNKRAEIGTDEYVRLGYNKLELRYWG